VGSEGVVTAVGGGVFCCFGLFCFAFMYNYSGSQLLTSRVHLQGSLDAYWRVTLVTTHSR
jgi:hypothetical protein